MATVSYYPSIEVISASGSTTSAPGSAGNAMELSITDLNADLTFWIAHVFCSVVLVGLISLVGIVSNLLTIFVLSRQANENMNIAFLGMTISDLCVTILALWFVICSILNVINPPNFAFEPLSFLIVTAVIPRFSFLSSTCWLTALIAVIRCLCVALPFKVGILFTVRRTAVLTFIVFVVFVLGYSSTYFRDQIFLVYFPAINASKYVMLEISKGPLIDNLAIYLGFVALPLTNIFIVVFCTITLVVKVKASSNWRRSGAHATAGNQLVAQEKNSVAEGRQKTSTKESKLTRMVIAIMVLFIICSTPNNLLIMTRLSEPSFNERGVYRTLYSLINDIIMILETFNSSVSLFIFYTMSSKFKAEVHKLLPFLLTNQSRCWLFR